jgi:DeoD family purine-nucleoside phosphorylase
VKTLIGAKPVAASRRSVVLVSLSILDGFPRARVTQTETIHLHPTAPLAERVLLPGDPGRALLLAQALLDSPAMFNHHRGLWGYTGAAADGAPLTIQSTGIGGPSAAIVIAELADLGARRLLRVGTCGAVHPDLELGDLLIVTEAISEDGTSRALSAAAPQASPIEQPLLKPATALLNALVETKDPRSHTGAVVSTDLFYDGAEREEERWIAAGALAVEMETATLLALAARRDLQAASLLLVSDLLLGGRTRIDADALQAGEHRLGEAAVRALSADAGPRDRAAG